MVNGMRAPVKPVGHSDVLWGLPGQGGLLTEWAEIVPDLTWPESVRTYGRMRRDSRLAAVLKAFFLPILRATWQLDPNGASDEAVKLCSQDLGLPIRGEKVSPKAAPPDGFTWYDHCRLALDHLVFGHMAFEQWFAIRGGQTRLAGVQERQPHTISIIDVDDDGSIRGVYQNTQEKPIGPNRLIWYVNEKTGANWAGVSILRPCYTNWILKHETMRVHATSIRRFGMGVPQVTAPPGATPAQLEESRRLASGMRAGDTAGAGMPAGFDYQLKGMTGSAPDALGFLQYLNQEMTGSALAQIIELGNTTYGSRAVGETFMDLFMLSLQAIADYIGETATFGYPGMPGVARSLVEYNWGQGQPVPKIVAKDVGERHEVTAEGIAALVTSGAVQADPALENYMRAAYGLPDRSTPWTPPPPKGGPGGGAPAGPGPKAPGGGAGGTAAPSSSPGNTKAAAGVPGGLRRDLTPTEAAAGLDPYGLRRDLEIARDRLVAQWVPVLTAQRHELADQVAAAVDDGHIGSLASLSAPTTEAAVLLYRAMTGVAAQAAGRMVAEAAGQGVEIDPAAVTLPRKRLRQLAQARAALAAQHEATAASRTALQAVQVVTASAGTDAAGQVTAVLAGLSPRPLADELMAAMHAASNAGRFAVLDAGPGASYVASEILDDNTCPKCAGIDGHEFASLDDAQAAYGGGGYTGCDGGLRCRGTVVAVWPDLPRPEPGQATAAAGDEGERSPKGPAAGVAADWDEGKHPRGQHGEWVALDWDGLDRVLQSEFHPARIDAAQVKHPRSGYMVDAGISRNVTRPADDGKHHGNESLGPEGPATFDLTDHGDPHDPSYNSLAYMLGKHVGTEPIAHVYRGMSAGEWDQARQRGFIASDERGAISPLEGTNAAVDPRTAVSYLPPSGDSYVAKIKVRPEDKWFTIGADEYLRTRQRIPLDRVEHVVRFRKTGKYGSDLAVHRPPAKVAAGRDPEAAWHFNPLERRDRTGKWDNGGGDAPLEGKKAAEAIPGRYKPDNRSWDIDSVATALGRYMFSANADDHRLNSGLRKDRGDLGELAGEWEGDTSALIARMLDQGMQQSALTHSITVLRGVASGKSFLGPAWRDDSPMTGASWTDYGFTSTTTDPKRAGYFYENHAQPDHLMLNITVPAGTHALGLTDTESEVLLDRGLTYTVTGDRMQHGHRTLDVTASQP
jgi:hypothetical protein